LEVGFVMSVHTHKEGATIFSGKGAGRQRGYSKAACGHQRSGHIVRDANGQALTYLYSRDNPTEALQARMLTKDEARRIAVNIAAAGAAREGGSRLSRGDHRVDCGRAQESTASITWRMGSVMGVCLLLKVLEEPASPVETEL
jgi:hypothetical protein